MGRGSLAGPFAGFPASGQATALPNLFFSGVLPQIEQVEELIVTLYFFFTQGRKRGSPRFLTAPELAADTTLMRTLANFGDDPQAALALGLTLAVQRGTLLRADLEAEGGRQELYFLNTPASRRAMARLSEVRMPEPLPPGEVASRPNIFALYEENVGTITPLMAEELRDAEARYPWEWIVAAFREAVAMNKRNWRYINAILRDWEAKGPDYETIGRDTQADAGPRWPLSGRYRHLFRR